MNKLKQAGLFVLLLLALITLISFALDFFYKQSDFRSIGKINKLLAKKIDPDIMIFGSSVAEVHFMPDVIQKITGKTGYNMGIDGTELGQYQGLIYSFASESRQCKYVVIGVTYFSFTKRGLIMAPDKYLAHLDNPYVYNYLSRIDPVITKAKYVPGYKLTLQGRDYYKGVYTGIANYLGHPLKDTTFNKDGFYPKYMQWTDQNDINNKNYKIANIPIDLSIIQDYKNVISFLNKKGIKVVIVFTPLFVEAHKLVPNMEEVKNTLMNVVGTNNYFMDYSNDSMCYNKNYFYNNSHLNIDGAKVFSEKFAKKLKDVL